MKKILILAAAAAMTFAACEKAQNPVNDGLKEVKFTTNLNHYAVKAVDENALNDIKVIAGSPINLVSDATVSGSALTVNPAMYWGAGQTTATKFIAITGGQTSPVVDSWDYSDDYVYNSQLMSAVATGTPSDSEIQLTFNHVFSKVVINIDNQLGQDKVKSVVVSNLANNASVNFETGSVTASDTRTGVATAQEITENAEYAVVILPQTSSPVITVTTDLDAVYVFTVASAFTFQGGKVASTSIELTGSTKEASGLNPVSSLKFAVNPWGTDNTALSAGKTSENLGDKYWYIVGTINGDSWTKAYPLTMTGANVWSVDFTYNGFGGTEEVAGAGFKLHYGPSFWNSFQVGADPSAQTLTLGSLYYGWPNSANNANFKLAANGDYTLTYDLSNVDMSDFTKVDNQHKITVVAKN